VNLPRAGLYRLLPTEQPNLNARRIDRESSLTIVRKMNRGDQRAAEAVGREAKNIARAAEIVAEGLRSGGRIFFVGAGTSGRLCVMEAAECPNTFGIAPARMQALMAGGNASVFRSREGAEDDSKDGARQVSRRAKAGDVVVGVAASGVTPFVYGALRAAQGRRCRTILVTSNSKPRMPKADVIVCPRVGPEIVAGSTRLKAGTAAKLALNTLTTVAMIRLGKVYAGWMVDLKATSRKLRLRAARMVCRLGKVRPADAEALLRHTGGSVKTAVLAARMRHGTMAERAARSRKLLETCDGSLTLALERLGKL